MILLQKKIILCGLLMTLALVFFTRAAAAQEKELEEIKKFIKKSRVNAAYIMGGLNYLDFNSLNTFLENKGMPAVERYNVSLGLGGHVIHNKVVAGLEIVHTIEKYGPSKMNFNTSIMAKYMVLNFGYLVHHKKGLMLYPYAGIGVGRLTLRVTENNIDSFDDITDSQGGSVSRRTLYLVNMGISLDFFYKYHEKKKGQNNLVLGVRAGYLCSPLRRHWRVNHIRVADGPNSGINGPYIRFVIGFGGWIEKLIKKAI